MSSRLVHGAACVRISLLLKAEWRLHLTVGTDHLSFIRFSAGGRVRGSCLGLPRTWVLYRCPDGRHGVVLSPNPLRRQSASSPLWTPAVRQHCVSQGSRRPPTPFPFLFVRFPGRLVSFPLCSPVPTHLLGLHSAAASSRKPPDPMTFLKGVLRRRSDSGPERRPERWRLRPAAPGCTRHALPARPADREGLEGRAVPSSPFRPPRPHT